MQCLYSLILLAICNQISIGRVNGETCFTQFNESGECVSIRTCTIIWKLITEAPKPLPARLTEYIRRSQCGDVKERKICCRLKDIERKEEISSAPNTFGGSVFDHPNLKLVNADICGLGSQNRISNGNKTLFYEFPWSALLGYKDSIGHIEYNCGGSLITTRFVLTAAHCVPQSESLKLVTVRLGEYDTSTDVDCVVAGDEKVCTPSPQDIEIDQIIVHPQYVKQRKENDIAVIKLARNADISDISVRPICLPITKELYRHNPDKYIVAGWGKTENGSKSEVLLKATVSPYQRDRCQQTLSQLSKRIKLTNAHFCAGGEGNNVDTCSGDSGSPIQALAEFKNEYRLIQYGIVSFGPSSCGHGASYPSVYTDLRHFLTWVLDNLSIQ